MSPRIRNASLRWRLGKIAHREKRARERAMLGRYLVKAAVPARRRPISRGKPLIDIPPKPAGWLAAEQMGLI